MMTYEEFDRRLSEALADAKDLGRRIAEEGVKIEAFRKKLDEADLYFKSVEARIKCYEDSPTGCGGNN